MKLFCKKKEPATYDEKYLVEEINLTKAALSAAYANFDNATDPDLIDCYIYQLNSEQKRYKYLLQKAKESEIYSYIPNIWCIYIWCILYILYVNYIVNIFFSFLISFLLTFISFKSLPINFDFATDDFHITFATDDSYIILQPMIFTSRIQPMIFTSHLTFIYHSYTLITDIRVKTSFGAYIINIRRDIYA